MTRDRPLLAMLLSPLLAAAPAHADVEPPPQPTVYLMVESKVLAEKTEAIKSAVKSALPRLPKAWSLSVVNGCKDSESRYEASPRWTASEATEILATLTRGASCTGYLPSALSALLWKWSGSDGKPRQHLVLLSAEAPTVSLLGDLLDTAVRRGFTVSFLSLGKVAASDRRDLQKRGCGRVHEVVPGPRLIAALRTELAWTRLSKAQELAMHKAREAWRPGQLVRTGRRTLTSSGGSPGAVTFGSRRGPGPGTGGGSGGLGLKGVGDSSKNPRLRRAESRLGSKLALTFRQVSCTASCDLADARRQLLGASAPLLQCLEGALSLSGREEVTVQFAAGKVTGARSTANACVQGWLAKAPRGFSATLLVGPVSAVE